MQHTLIGLDRPDEWSAALTSIRHTHAHTHSHVAAFAASSDAETLLYVGRDESGEPAVACPLSLRGDPGEQDVYSPYGFGGFASDRSRPGFAVEWDAFAASQGWVASYVLQHPSLDQHLGFDPATPIPCFVLDLARPADELLAGMSQGRRRELRNWAPDEGSVTHDPAEVLAFLLEVADDFFRDRDAASVYSFRPETWTRLLAAPTIRVEGLRQSGEVTAAVVTGAASGIVDYLFSVSRPGAGAYSAPLVWQAVQGARAEGATSMNLGGGIRPEDSVAEFKRRFGAPVVPARVVRQVHRRDVYLKLCRRAAVRSDPDGFFPPYRRRT